MKRFMLSAAGALAILPGAVAAQDTAAVSYIHAGRLLDRPGEAPRGPSTVVVRDGRIVEIRDGFVDAAEHEALAAARKTDMEGKCGEGKCGGMGS